VAPVAPSSSMFMLDSLSIGDAFNE
jgi:hypothetical protein